MKNSPGIIFTIGIIIFILAFLVSGIMMYKSHHSSNYIANYDQDLAYQSLYTLLCGGALGWIIIFLGFLSYLKEEQS